MSQETVKVALLGCGVVGAEVARLITDASSELPSRIGRSIELTGIAVRDLSRERSVDVDPGLFTTDAASLVTHADIVIELMGGIEPARTLILSAMKHGASVVTANKALLADDGPTLYEAADRYGVDLSFEAAVAAAIPLIRPVRESLSGDRVSRVLGIVNGTTNYVLDQMDTHQLGFSEAVAQAQELGYAEADPTADIEGFDAAAKAAILASLAFHTRVNAQDVYREGITKVTASDVAAAKAAGCVIKLLAICERTTNAQQEQAVSVRVYPAMMMRDHPLGAVRGPYNAVFVEADAAGSLMFYGQGAGGQPTASAILGDVVSIARQRLSGGYGPRESAYANLPVAPMEDTITSYHIRLHVADAPGVLASVATVFADNEVSIETMRQSTLEASEQGDASGGLATLVISTHPARDGDLQRTVEALRELDVVAAVASVLRVEGD